MTSLSGPVRIKSSQNHLSKMAFDQVLNVNDLLNFTLPPRQQRPFASTPRRSRKTATSQGFWNKERFVNAQYRFVMNPTGDYTAHFADPDIFFQWHDILQVIIPRTSALSAATDGETSAQDEGFITCPICLSPPTASRMTKCGHVFCYPCILHYMSTSENKWARCPICFDSVNERQLKSVEWFDRPEPSSTSSSSKPIFVAPHVGSLIEMRLIQRPQITTLGLPRSPTWPSDLLPPHQTPYYFLPDVYNFAKFMLATPDYLIDSLSRDLDELAAERRVLQSTNDLLGVVFIDAAEAKVREQIAKASALDTPILKAEIEKIRHELEETVEKSVFFAEGKTLGQGHRAAHGVEEIPHEFLALSSPSTTNSASPTSLRSLSRNQPRQRRNLNPPPPSTSSYYFYQAASGLPLYLHPLDIRILLSHFHSYSSFPDTIVVRVEFVSVGSVNDDLRKRCKYLAHMPEGTDVAFIESDLEGVVGSQIKHFEAPLKMRTSKRKEKERKEEKSRFKAEEREKEKLNASLSGWPCSAHAAILDGHARAKIESSSSNGPTPTPMSAAISSGAGVWGTRTFASALHSSSTPGSVSQQKAVSQPTEEELDIDVAWHELEQKNGGGRRKRANKLVILGSGGGARRR